MDLLTKSDWASLWLDAKAVVQDLEQLQSILEQRHSYFSRHREEFLLAIAELKEHCTQGCTRGKLTTEISLLLHRLHDGHTRINSDQFASSQLGTKLPFTLQSFDARYLALTANQVLLHAGFPFLKSLDGIPLETWLEAARVMTKAGGSQAQRLRVGKALTWLGFFRQKLGLPERKILQVELESASGEVQTLDMPTLESAMVMSAVSKPLQQILEPNIGYLFLQQMENTTEFLDSLIPAMYALQDTRGLIIDVRGNSGGTRHALRLLFPFFLHPNDVPHIYTVATVRIPENEARDDPEGYLADRFLYPITASLWTEPEQAFIRTFAAQFAPAWQPPLEQFSALHFGILPRSEQHYYYEKPVVLLIDERCASATDVFVGAFKGWRNTTLIGTNTMGTSGRPETYTLEQSGIKFLASSMVSYRTDGQLYEGLGIAPDIVMPPTLTDLVGKTDSILEAAVQLLRA